MTRNLRIDNRSKDHGGLVVPMIVLAVLLLSSGAITQKSAPLLVTRYGGGLNGRAWEVRIEPDGHLYGPESQLLLTRDEVRHLESLIDSARFFDLQDLYSNSLTDQPCAVLEVHLKGRTKRVAVSPYPHTLTEDLQRFDQVWTTVVHLAWLRETRPQRDTDY